MNETVELSISCGDCVRRGTPDCADCLVSFVLGETPDEMTLTGRDAEVVELFATQGMIPRLRFHPANPRQ
ncbi:MAG TPA: hypothetical protein VMV96_05465 [Acidimicrobiales bacterium]|nr:hypothetical protein [Acidimicrobiales bacterium]